MLGWTMVRTRKWQALHADLEAAQNDVSLQAAAIARLLQEKSRLEAELQKARKP